MNPQTRNVLVWLAILAALASCTKKEEAAAPTPAPIPTEEAPAPAPAPEPAEEKPKYPTRPFFGDTHLHTSILPGRPGLFGATTWVTGGGLPPSPRG